MGKYIWFSFCCNLISSIDRCSPIFNSYLTCSCLLRRFCVRSIWCMVLLICVNATYHTMQEVERRCCCCLHVQNGVLKDLLLQLVREDWYTLGIHTCRTLIIMYNMAIIIFLICAQMVKDTKGMEGTQHNIPQQGHKSCILTAPHSPPPQHTHIQTRTHAHTHLSDVHCNN